MSTNSTVVLGASDISDHPLCIGVGLTEWPIYSRRSITAVYYQHRFLALDDGVMETIVSSIDDEVSNYSTSSYYMMLTGCSLSHVVVEYELVSIDTI